MSIGFETLQLLREAIGYGLLASVVAFVWSPLLIKFLYKFNITRRNEYDATLVLGARKSKYGVPIMGGLLVVITVALMTLLFNWDRRFTWMPVLVMGWSALLGGIDDLLNIFGNKRRSRKLKQIVRLIQVHRHWYMRVWYIVTLPWSIFKRTSVWLSSHPGKGVHVHEKLLLQFIAGAMTAWWVFFKLADHWREIQIPFDGYVNIGFWMIPVIVLFVMLTANAVNIADGMDGLAGGALLVTFSALTFLAWMQGLQSIAILNATTTGALLTYTYFNIKPARFQMGDVGSLGLGALLAINTIVLNHMLLLPLFGFIFYIELASVFIQVLGRHAMGRKIFRMAPLHHHFEMLGWGEQKTVMRFWVIHAAFVLLGMWIALS